MIKKFPHTGRKVPRSNRGRNMLIGGVAMVLLMGFGGYTVYVNNVQEEDSTTLTADELTAQDETVGNGDFKSDPEPASTSDSDITLPPENKPYIQIRSASQSGGTPSVFAPTPQVGGAGKCVFTFSNSEDRPVVREVEGDGSTCQASIPSVEFSKIGVWNLNISYYRGQTKIVGTDRNVTVN